MSGSELCALARRASNSGDDNTEQEFFIGQQHEQGNAEVEQYRATVAVDQPAQAGFGLDLGAAHLIDGGRSERDEMEGVKADLRVRQTIAGAGNEGRPAPVPRGSGSTRR